MRVRATQAVLAASLCLVAGAVLTQPATAGKPGGDARPKPGKSPVAASPSPSASPSPATSPSPSPVASPVSSPVSSPTSSPTSTASASTTVGPRGYYLALGDSLAFGQQPDNTYAQGSSDLFTEALRLRAPGLQQVNLGCPGESVRTMVSGGCPFQVHTRTDYSGRTQLQEALRQIAALPGQVSPVTLQLGMNDALGLMDPGTRYADGSCLVHPFADAAAEYGRGLSSLVGQLRSALGGTGDLLLLNTYDVYESVCSNTHLVFDAFDAQVAQVGAAHGVPVVDVGGALAGRICSTTGYTIGCPGVDRPTKDIHPYTAGYRLIADAIAARYP